MKVVVLGGYGHYGRHIARKLAARDIVTTLVVAGRSLEKARAQADLLGAKAMAARVDLFEAADTIVSRKVKSLPVVEDGRVVGVVYRSALYRSMAENILERAVIASQERSKRSNARSS